MESSHPVTKTIALRLSVALEERGDLVGGKRDCLAMFD
jgi:hypothetical protein